MSKYETGTKVTLRRECDHGLLFPPDEECELRAVEPGDGPGPSSPLTQVLGLVDGALRWAGALDENLLEFDRDDVDPRSVQAELEAALLRGKQLWSLVEPGPLRRSGDERNDVVYQGRRPWLVVGETASGALLAMPLNESPGEARRYQARLFAADVFFRLNRPSKPSNIELSHVWSLPSTTRNAGQLKRHRWRQIEEKVLDYFEFAGRNRD